MANKVQPVETLGQLKARRGALRLAANRGDKSAERELATIREQIAAEKLREEENADADEVERIHAEQGRAAAVKTEKLANAKKSIEAADEVLVQAIEIHKVLVEGLRPCWATALEKAQLARTVGASVKGQSLDWPDAIWSLRVALLNTMVIDAALPVPFGGDRNRPTLEQAMETSRASLRHEINVALRQAGIEEQI